MSDFEPQQSGISRRTVTKAMAWAVPAVAVAAPAPAFAASCKPVPVVANGSCKKANESSYKLFFTISATGCSTAGCTGTIEEIKQSTGQGLVLWTGSEPADGQSPVIICDSPNMANFLLVRATIVCGETVIPSAYYQVAMPNFNSANNQCADSNFCMPV